MRIKLFILLSVVWLPAGVPYDRSAEAQSHADRGLQLLREGDLQHAETELRLSVQLDPENSVNLGSLGAVLGMEHRLDESDVYLERALRLNPADWTTRRNLASNQFQLGQLEPARRNLQLVLKTAPDDNIARLLLGMVAEQSKDYSSAVKWLVSVPGQVRQRPEPIVALATACYKVGQKEKARQALKELLSHTDWAQGVFLGGQAAAQADDYEMAERMFESVPATYPDTVKLGYSLALAQYHRNEISGSQATLEKLLAAGHETSEIENLLGWCAFKQARYRDAVAALDRAIMLDASRESNYLDVGMMMLEIRRYDAAQLAAAKAVRVAPASAQAYRLQGLVEFKRGSLIDARQSYARAVELDPNDVEAILGLASAQWSDGKFAEASGTFEKAVARMPKEPLLYQGYGTMLLGINDRGNTSEESRAITLLRRATALDSSLPEPHYQLGGLALRQGRNQEAVEELEMACRLGPDVSKYHYTLAQVYRALGRRDDATRQLELYKHLKAEEERPGAGLARNADPAAAHPLTDEQQ